jgi:ATP-binding cassette subfamily B protein
MLLALQALLSPLQLALSRALIDRAAAALQLAAVRDPLAARLPLGAWIALAAAGVAAGQLIQPFVEAFQSLAGDRLTGYVSEQIISAANRWQGLARFENPGFFDDLERARRHASQAGLNVVVFVARSILSLFTIVGLALILLALHPLAPILIILATIPQMARQFEYRHLTSTHLYIQTPEARRLDYSRTTLLTPEPAKDVRLYGLGPFFRRRYDLSFERATATLSRLRRRLMAPMALATALSATAVGAAYVYVVWLIAHGQRSLGDLALYGGAATLLHMTLLSLGFDITSAPMGLGVFLPSLFRVLDAPPDLPLPRNPRHAPRPIRQGIVFDHVAFTYAGHDVPVLQDVSFCIRPDECIALVGRNGAGKTTIVKLLLRLYDPPAGASLLDGVDLRQYDLEDLRREMGVTFQDFVRYALTAGSARPARPPRSARGGQRRRGRDGLAHQPGCA